MTLPASGTISMSMVNTELGLGATNLISLNDAAVRTLFGKPSGAISMSDGHGKSNTFSTTFDNVVDDYPSSSLLGMDWYIRGYNKGIHVTPSDGNYTPNGTMANTSAYGYTIAELIEVVGTDYEGGTGHYQEYRLSVIGNLVKAWFITMRVGGVDWNSVVSSHSYDGTYTHWRWPRTYGVGFAMPTGVVSLSLIK